MLPTQKVMPLLEWLLVAGAPTLLCFTTFHANAFNQCETSPQLFTYEPSESSSCPSFNCRQSDSHFHLKFNKTTITFYAALLVMGVTALLTFVSVLMFGDESNQDSQHRCGPCCGAFINGGGAKSSRPRRPSCKSTIQSSNSGSVGISVDIPNKNKTPSISPYNANSRGLGIVMGSHLIPMLYASILLFLCKTDQQEEPNNMCLNDAIIFFWAIGLRQMVFASLGGFAFAASYLWVRCISGHWGGKQCHDFQSMGLCWKLNLFLHVCTFILPAISFNQQRVNFRFIDSDVLSLLYGLVHCAMISCYNQQYYPVSAMSWQSAFTPGEWLAVSTLLTSLICECFIQHVFVHFGGFFVSPSALFVSPWPVHLVVAHAGLTGCILGVGLTFLTSKLTHFFSPKRCYPLEIIMSILCVVGATVTLLEIALTSRWDASGSVTTNSLLTNHWGILIYVPKSIRWLISFLLQRTVSDGLHDDEKGASRLSILGYWILILLISWHLALRLVSWVCCESVEGQEGLKRETSGNKTLSDKQKHENQPPARDLHPKKRVITARKFFHVVAVALFAPISDHGMMALSYAIAIALLIALELLRHLDCMETFDEHFKSDVQSVEQKLHTSSLTQFFMVFFDDKDSSAANGGLAFTHIALVVGCAFPLWVHQLLCNFVSIRTPSDICNSEQKFGAHFVWEHALPLNILPYLGILLLGVGDSAGAICGIRFGRCKWPGSSRTLEGSFCMWASMLFVFGVGTIIFHVDDEGRRFSQSAVKCVSHLVVKASLPLGALTLIEASTIQIDNLCLPIAGSTLSLLLSTLGQDILLES